MPWSRPEPVLYSPVSGHVGEGMVGLKPHDELSVGDFPLCLDEPGSVTITSVEPMDVQNGMTVVAFAVRTIPVGDVPLGNAVGGLGALGLTVDQQKNRIVDNVCGEQSRSNVGLDGPAPAGTMEKRVELDVTLTAPTIPASARAFRIYYVDASGAERFTISPITITMCAGKVGDDCPSK